MNLFFWMHFRAWGWLLLWFHEVLMVMDGAARAGGTHIWTCCNAQVLLALRSSCASSSWKKQNSRQRKCGRRIQVFISGGIKQPVLSTLISAGTVVLLLHGFSTKAQQALKLDEAAAGERGSKSPQVSVVGTMPAADDTVYLEYCSAPSKTSSNKHPPTILWFHEKPLQPVLPEYQIPLS